MRPDDFHHDCQTQTGAFATHAFAPPKTLEEVGSILGWDARTAVLHADRTLGVDLDDHLRSRRRMDERVFDQIPQRVCDRRGISDDDDRLIGAG